MSGRLVFLTGATGFIGLRLARLHAQAGDRLRCMVRHTRSPASVELESLGAELIPGDLIDDVALEHGFRNADLAYHLAAVYDIGVVNAGALENTNVDGTRNFIRMLERANVRGVHVSSTAALGPVASGEGDETSSYSGPYPSIYHRTKTHAHRIAREAQERGAPLIIACPANVYGPGDEGPHGRFIRDILRGRVPAMVANPSWYSYVHVDDVAQGLFLIGERGQVGTTYVLAGEAERIDRFAARVAAAAGKRGPFLKIPAPMARLTGAVLDRVGRATGRRFSLSVEGVNIATRDRWVYSNARATNELGWHPRGIDEGLKDTIAAFQASANRKTGAAPAAR